VVSFKFSCDHALCNTHHLRELTYLAEQDQQDWADKIMKFLLEAKDLVEATSANCLAKDSAELASIDLRYDEILATGFAQDIPPPRPTGKKKRGRRKQPKAKNMRHFARSRMFGLRRGVETVRFQTDFAVCRINRLRDFKAEVLAFLTHPRIPFDNNQGERDMRTQGVFVLDAGSEIQRCPAFRRSEQSTIGCARKACLF